MILVGKSKHSANSLHYFGEAYITVLVFEHNFEFKNCRTMETTAIRQWAEDEKNKLIDLVELNYGFLFEGLSPQKTKQMVDQKWLDIVNEINSLGMGSAPLTVKKAKKKWADMKSISKKTVAKWKNEANRTGGGPNTATKPNEMHFRIANFIGYVHTFGIPGTEKCDIAAVTTSYAETANNSPAPTQLSTVCYRDLFDTENPPFNVDSNSSPRNSLSLTQDDNYSIASSVAQVGNTPPVASLILAEVPVPPKKKRLSKE